MNVNWDTVLLALKISGVGIFVLLLVLAALALIISLLTRFIKDKPEEGDDEVGEEAAAPVAEVQTNDLGKIAAIAVAIARAQSEFTFVSESTTSTLSNWGQFHLSRRLNLSSSIRRSK
jgi:Na+-transporting methylmalonyl-CoA/oxaloacetate decarboxylase gamma subunit